MTIRCQVCQREVKQITGSHLKKAHGITLDQYKQAYPKAPIVDQEISKAISTKLTGRKRSQAHKDALSRTISEQFKNGREAHNKGKIGWRQDSDITRDLKRQKRLGKKHNQATKDKIGDAHRGKTVSLASIEKQKDSMRRAIERNGGGFAVGPRSQDFKDRMSEIALARPETEWRPKVNVMNEARRNQEITDDMRETYREARLRYMEANPDKLHKKFFNTVPELEFKAELEKLGLQYTHQFHTKNPHFVFDFMVEDEFLVEIDGPYHYMLSIHHGDQRLLDKQIAKDARKNMAAGQAGFKIVRLEVGQHIPKDWKEILLQQGWTLKI